MVMCIDRRINEILIHILAFCLSVIWGDEIVCISKKKKKMKNGVTVRKKVDHKWADTKE